MKDVLVVISSHYGIDPRSNGCVQALIESGASLIHQVGSSCVATARNLALTSACSSLKAYPHFNTVLMIDDDMVFTVNDVLQIVELSVNSKRAVSGIYVNAEGGATLKTIDNLILSGLGMLAIPKDLLLDIESKSESVNGMRVFTWVDTENGEWITEDFRLTLRLGGVILCPVKIGHLKKIVIYPSDFVIGK
jgi:hypothetical protein